MKNIAIIPARGGSKRIPYKNIKEFHGKPIIAYSIECALETNLFDEVMVSTDDRIIADIAIKYGASVPFMRSATTSGDYSSTLDVLKEVEGMYRKEYDKSFDFICCIYATAPFIKSEHLKKGYRMIFDQGYSSVFPVVRFSYPIWRGLRINALDKIEMIWHEYLNSRSQDLESVYHDAGQWYWNNPKLVEDSLFTENSSSVILSDEEVQDIDTINDWKLAEIKYEYIQSIKKASL